MLDGYSVAVKLTLINSVSSGLASIAQQLSGLHPHFNQAQQGANRLKRELLEIQKMGLIGGAAAAAGFAGLSLLKKPTELAAQWQTEVTRFKALGLGEAATNEATKFAKGMDIMGQSAQDNMKLVREATTIMGDLKHAEAVAPLLAKMKFGIESVMHDGHGDNFDSMFQAVLKTAELRGALVDRQTGHIDTDKFARTLNMTMQAYVASGGRSSLRIIWRR